MLCYGHSNTSSNLVCVMLTICTNLLIHINNKFIINNETAWVS